MAKPFHIFLSGMCFILAGALSSPAQQTRVEGRVTDATSGEPVPFANIVLKGTTIGVTSGMDGYYLIETTRPADSVHVSFIGYQPQSREITKGKSQVIDFKLISSSVNLNEIVVLPEEELIELLMKRLIRKKKYNDPEQIGYYECEVYSKFQVDLNNISDEFQKRRIFRPFEFVFENIDTNQLNNKAYLPIFLSETVSDFYYRKEPRTTREYIRANQVSGVNNTSITQYLGGISQSVNIYDNYLIILDKNFSSPISDFGLSTYDYVLEDTVIMEGEWYYQISFSPKRKQELTFTGTMLVHDTSFAVKQIDMQVTGDANFNFVSGYVISQVFEKVNGQYWFVVHDYRLMDLNPIENTRSLVGSYVHRTASYRNVVFNEPKEKEFYATPLNVVVNVDAYDKGADFWEDARHDSLSDEEKAIYSMVDSVKRVPVFKTWEDIFYLVTSGYLITGKFEIGPLYKSLSFNDIEGIRLRFGGRTSNTFSKKIMLDGHIAYGFKDEKFKFGGGFLYMLSKNPRRSVGGSYKYDLEQLGQDQAAFSEDNFFAAFFRRSPANKLNMVTQYLGYYEHEWFTGFSNVFRFIHRDVGAIGDNKFFINESPTQQYVLNSIVSSEIQVGTRFAYRERFLYGEFERTSLGTRYPVVEMVYGYGIPNFLGSMFEYHRLQFRISHKINLWSIGQSKYIVEAGKFWGRLPYPMLKLHEGNETILFYENSSNLMNYYEFISDIYASAYYTHHFGGLLFNKIPGIRKLKLREVVHGRAVWGSLSEENAQYSVFPAFSGPLDTPYFEAGVGIENILKVGRIDAIWRLNHLDAPNSDPFRIFITFQFVF